MSVINALGYKGVYWSFINAPWENSMIGTEIMSTKIDYIFAYAGWKFKRVITRDSVLFATPNQYACWSSLYVRHIFYWFSRYQQKYNECIITQQNLI